MPAFTPELIQEYVNGYEVAINEVTQSLAEFVETNNNLTIAEDVGLILTQLEAIKNCVAIPSNQLLMESVQKVSEDFISLCSSIYNYLVDVEEVVLRELMMESMQTALHNLMTIEVAVATKSLYYPIFNPDLMLYISFRALLVIVSIILKTLTTLDLSHDEERKLSQKDIESSIAYILHFGRALFKGEEKLLSGEVEVEVELPNTNNNTTNTNNTTLKKTDSNTQIQPKVSITTTKTKDNTNTTTVKTSNNNNTTTNNTNNNDTTTTKTKDNTNTTTKTKDNTNTTTVKTSNNNNTTTNNTNNNDTTTTKTKDNTTNNNTNGGEYDPFNDDTFLMECDPDSYNKNNVPPGYPQAPFVMKFEKGQSEEIYKEFMRQKYEYERWENKLILHVRKLKARIAERKKELGQ